VWRIVRKAGRRVVRLKCLWRSSPLVVHGSVWVHFEMVITVGSEAVVVPVQ